MVVRPLKTTSPRTRGRTYLKDNGYGIEKNSIHRVFERFYRSSKARAHTKGTGLGLALVKQLSTRIGANVSVESKINVGTEFFVSFHHK